MIVRTLVAFVFLLLLLVGEGGAQEGGKIVQVSAGHVLKLDTGEIVMVYGVRCPSVNTALGRDAKIWTLAFTADNSTRVVRAIQSFGVTFVRVTNGSGEDLGASLIREGYGELDTSVAPDDPVLHAAAHERQEQVHSRVNRFSEESGDERTAQDKLIEFQLRREMRSQARAEAWAQLTPEEQEAALISRERRIAKQAFNYTMRLVASCNPNEPTIMVTNNEPDDVLLKLCGPSRLTLLIPAGQSLRVNAYPGEHVPIWKVGYGSYAEYRGVLAGMTVPYGELSMVLNASDGNTSAENLTADDFARR